ncbi:MAG: tRNA pseudouridine(38-40) synthase TruA [Planctomycetota bacterium]
MRNVRLLLAYDGSQFFGWQRQDGFPTVQAALEEAVEGVLGERSTLFGSGRTDTGVHALGQVAHLHVATRIPDDKFAFALNAHLPRGVVVRAAETCSDEFHAQYSASGKRYVYRIRNSRVRSPFGSAYEHRVPVWLDLEAMRRGARHLVGTHDFSALANAGSPRKSNVRTLRSLRLVRRGQGYLLAVDGSGFLYNMVRTIAGTLIEVGRGRMEADALPAILASRDRTLAGPTAPASGLYLLSVRYEAACFAQPVERVRRR